ncbi:hypothetical protein SANA_08080 [Gottschalkiaceae bacterium SANA]|nr:hypothetical protein SANA_08080 [Gottschalkiaceae bacterium SANA]
MKKKMIVVVMVGIALLLVGLGVSKVFGLGFKKVAVEELDVPGWRMEQSISNPNYEFYKDEYDIVRNTDALSGAAKKYYSKYMDYKAPNGKAIRLLAMDQVKDEQLLYAHSILSFYLSSNENIDKTSIANQMADSHTVLIIPNGADRDGKTPMAAMALGQNLNQMEIANVGSKWYIDCDYQHRDASFEEIFHMVHDYGVGTRQNPGADPAIAEMIGLAKDHALPLRESDWGKKGLWGFNSVNWLKELSKEGSLEQEYIVSVIDSYYGLWDSWADGQGGMWGIYCAKNRKEIAEKDPKGKAIVDYFLNENIDQMLRVDPSFEGEFFMTQEESKPYTTKSQYLQKISLTGSKDSALSANELDNTLMGNSGFNRIDGKSGNDVVQFRGHSGQYTIVQKNSEIVVTDQVQGRDGVNTLINIELLRFTDKDLKMEEHSM